MHNPNVGNGADDLLNIEYCLAVPSTLPGCTVSLSRALLVVVIVFNISKVVCFIVALRICTSPLITIGDALASFLHSPDQTTGGFGLLSAYTTRRQMAWDYVRYKNIDTGKSSPPIPSRWRVPRRRLWFEAASSRRWSVTAIMFVCSAHMAQ